jgi:hypothetical protein
MRPYLKNTHHKRRLAEWLKVKALSLSPSTTRKKNERKKKEKVGVTLTFKDSLCGGASNY